MEIFNFYCLQLVEDNEIRNGQTPGAHTCQEN